MIKCKARIRPMRMVNETEIECDQNSSHEGTHKGFLKDYAWPGSITEISWLDDDRRSFIGDFVECSKNCKLPSEHRGEHVSPNAL